MYGLFVHIHPPLYQHANYPNEQRHFVVSSWLVANFNTTPINILIDALAEEFAASAKHDQQRLAELLQIIEVLP